MSYRTIDWCLVCPLADCDEGAVGCLMTGADIARRRQAALSASLAEWSADVRPHVLPRVFPMFGSPHPRPLPARGRGVAPVVPQARRARGGRPATAGRAAGSIFAAPSSIRRGPSRAGSGEFAAGPRGRWQGGGRTSDAASAPEVPAPERGPSLRSGEPSGLVAPRRGAGRDGRRRCPSPAGGRWRGSINRVAGPGSRVTG